MFASGKVHAGCGAGVRGGYEGARLPDQRAPDRAANACPAFIRIEVNKQLVALEDGFLLRFGAEDMNDGKARNFLPPAALLDPMRRYLEAHRPALLRGHQTSKLWESRLGGPLTTGGFTAHLAHITERAFGKAFRPHAFRHIAATSIGKRPRINPKPAEQTIPD